jgi:hypothetical protein
MVVAETVQAPVHDPQGVEGALGLGQALAPLALVPAQGQG